MVLLNAAEYDFSTIEEVIRKKANENKAYDSGSEVIVQRRIIKNFDRKYQSSKSLSRFAEFISKNI